MTKRELRKKATEEGKALFSLTINERPRGGGCVEYSGIADEPLVQDLYRVLAESLARETKEDSQ